MSQSCVYLYIKSKYATLIHHSMCAHAAWVFIWLAYYNNKTSVLINMKQTWKDWTSRDRNYDTEMQTTIIMDKYAGSKICVIGVSDVKCSLWMYDGNSFLSVL